MTLGGASAIRAVTIGQNAEHKLFSQRRRNPMTTSDCARSTRLLVAAQLWTSIAMLIIATAICGVATGLGYRVG